MTAGAEGVGSDVVLMTTGSSGVTSVTEVNCEAAESSRVTSVTDVNCEAAEQREDVI